MKLIAVASLEGDYNYTNKLPIKKILKRDYVTKFDLYKDFRRYVKKGRYALYISKDKTGKHPLFAFDTQLLDKSMISIS